MIRDRLVPALLTAAGVSLIAAGLLDYSAPAIADGATASGAAPEIIAPDATIGFLPPSLPPIDLSPTTGPSPSPSDGFNPDRVATRVVVDQLGIDLPVVKPREGYPQCNVAMYLPLSQPGNGRATYLYAHARDGMFGPIYERAILREHGGPKSMVTMLAQVYTSDDLLFEYEIVEVRLHQLDLDDALDARTEELWLQTSEGPKGTPGKTQLVGKLLIVLPATDTEAHPKARPVNCS